MNLLHRIEHWGNSHHPKWLDILRISLGVFLCYKGVDFLQNMSALIGFMHNQENFGSLTFIMIGHFIVFAHILGGILIATGFYTRLACLIQIPILAGAIFFISSGSNLVRPYSELFLTIITLLLLIYFLIVGNGPWAVKFKDENEGKIVHGNFPTIKG
ncbi:MAG: DoxX family protein [Ferruginibacter sp.]